MRGNPVPPAARTGNARSIPAYAGEPTDGGLPQRRLTVYPRVCGGTVPVFSGEGLMNGLSPRMRGNLATTSRSPTGERSIPAYAGEPLKLGVCPPSDEVYPRVCGGTQPQGLGAAKARGLSPRMRGNQSARTRGCLAGRSIPAYAGEPAR